ncbi:MAG TPA: GNAT family N-acetyltransferase [Anaerolineales bacterium]|nr:GNAT family N-acetyltransferase [Anaerolineales bacterium]
MLLESERLLLRNFHSLDGEPMMRVFGDPQVMRFGDGVQTRAWVDHWIATCLEDYRTRGFGPYAVVEKQRQRLIGYCGLFFFPAVNGRAEVEIGYRLERLAWGQGYATEAAGAVREYAFSSLGMRRLISIIEPANLASIRVAEKIGMQYESEVMFEGYTHPDHVYAITRV